MAWTLLQRVTHQFHLNGTTPSIAVSSTTAGTLLIIGISTPFDQGQTYTLPAGWTAPTRVINGTQCEAAVGYYLSNPGAITSIQISGVVSTVFTNVVVEEWQSDQSSYVKDVLTTNTGTAGNLTGTATLAHSGELVFFLAVQGAAQDTGSPTFDSGFTGAIEFATASTGTSYDEYDAAFSGTSPGLAITPGVSNTGDKWATILVAFDDTPVAGDDFPVVFAIETEESSAGLLTLLCM